MYCKECGKNIPSDSEYCPICGDKQGPAVGKKRSKKLTPKETPESQTRVNSEAEKKKSNKWIWVITGLCALIIILTLMSEDKTSYKKVSAQSYYCGDGKCTVDGMSSTFEDCFSCRKDCGECPSISSGDIALDPRHEFLGSGSRSCFCERIKQGKKETLLFYTNLQCGKASIGSHDHWAIGCSIWVDGKDIDEDPSQCCSDTCLSIPGVYDFYPCMEEQLECYIGSMDIVEYNMYHSPKIEACCSLYLKDSYDDLKFGNSACKEVSLSEPC